MKLRDISEIINMQDHGSLKGITNQAKCPLLFSSWEQGGKFRIVNNIPSSLTKDDSCRKVVCFCSYDESTGMMESYDDSSPIPTLCLVASHYDVIVILESDNTYLAL